MRSRILYHIAFWIAYVLFKTYLQFESDSDVFDAGKLMKLLFAQLVLLIVKIPLVYGFFYLIEKYLAREWPLQKIIVTTVILFLVSLAVFLPVKQLIVLRVIYGAEVSMSQTLNLTSILSAVFLLGFTCSIAVAVKMIRYTIRQKAREQEVVKLKLETELQFLKAQMNPHFLFNTLNNIYSLARVKSDQTADVVMKLSKLLRFILYESRKKSIPIADEIQVIENYIELEKIRYDKKLGVTLHKFTDNEHEPITPLILLPFVENAFKHGASESRFDSYINISIEVKNGELNFTCENSKSPSNEERNSEKIGMENIRRQLELVYKDYELEVSETEEKFVVKLRLRLNG